MLLLLFQGSALVSRAYPDPDGLAAAVDAALDALRPLAEIPGGGMPLAPRFVAES